MEWIAQEGETITRGNRGWQDDTHSAEASITGVLVGRGNTQKNFGDPRWQDARLWGSAKYGTKPDNFDPIPGEIVFTPDDVLTVIVTGWVHYLKILEDHPILGSYTFYRSLQEMEDVGTEHLERFMRTVK
jgi:hypothetical protein